MRRLPLLGLAAAAALYLLARRAYWVGFFNDDAFHIMGALSLLHGRYAELSAPGAPPLRSYLPGFSVILAPAALVDRGSLAAYPLASVALTLGALCLLWEGVLAELSPRARAAAAVSFALSPLVVSMSGAVLSDVPVLFFAALAARLARSAWRSDAPARWAPAACALAAACATRPTGAALALGAAAALGARRRWRPALTCLSSLLVLLPLRALQGRYASELAETSPWSPILANAAFYLRSLFSTDLLRWPGEPSLAVAAAVGAGAVACGYGAARLRRGPASFALAAAGAYAAVHLVWPKQAGRYMLPVLPFVAAALFAGLDELDRRLGALGRLPIAAAILSVVLSLRVDSSIVSASLQPDGPASAPPARTYAWIASNTKPDDIFAAELDGRLWLRTGRRCIRLPRAASAQSFEQALAAQDVRYLLISNADPFLRTSEGTGSSDPFSPERAASYLSDQTRYRLVFSLPEEGTTVVERL